jgi:hypothetical protein
MNCSPERDWNIGRGAGLRERQAAAMVVALLLLNACSEPRFEDAGSRNSLLEDRKACAAEIAESPAATAYHQNPAAHPNYVSQVFEDMNRCIEGKGWKQARSPQEQERLKEAITSELTHARIPKSITEPEQPEHSTY